MARKTNNLFPEPAVAVTGIGMITPLGISTAECWKNLLNGVSGISRIMQFDPSDCPIQVGGQLPDEYAALEKSLIHKRIQKQTGKSTRIAMMCAEQAWADSRLDIKACDPMRCAVIIGTSGSSVRGPDDAVSHPDKFKIIREMFNAPAARISLDHKFKGPSYTISSSSESGARAIINAYDLIRQGHVDVAVAGGTDTLLTPNFLKRLESFHCLCQDIENPGRSIKPFDKNRNGFAVSDGGCIVILELLESAIQRNANIYAVMAGYGELTDLSFSETHMQMADVMEKAISNASVSREKIVYICANATATIDDDRNETMAVKRIFGKHAYEMLISSNKSMIGHTFSASGAIGFAVAALTIKTGHVPPTINYETPDPTCDLNYVPNGNLSLNHIPAAISNTFAFNGHYDSIVLKAFPLN